MRCALTGHRDLPPTFDVNVLYDTLEESIAEGYDVFYCGMAMGFDLLALDCLVSLRQKYSIKLIACIPYTGQEKSFPPEEKEKYYRLLEWCDEKVVFNPAYRVGCYHARDRYMVENSDLLIAYCVKEKGGSAYTLQYAQKKGLAIKTV